ncbi:MAG: DUF1499 domain-containing protein [Mariprofundaceae bacterium]|nr:DUF1499 domain-containing protein [Mariprofundaceae bacterium]
MKIILISIITLLLLGLLAYIVMAILSQKSPDDLGLQNQQLRPCPDSPNCVCSEKQPQQNSEHDISPIQGDQAVWDKLISIIQKQGGNIISQQNNYLHATFSTSIMHYVDDVELRFDQAKQTIHMRSASRVGRKDFGINRNRVEAIQQAL